MQMNELDRLSVLAPEDVKIKTDLAKLYQSQNLFDDQIAVLRDLLEIDPNNEGAQSDLAQAYEKVEETLWMYTETDLKTIHLT